VLSFACKLVLRRAQRSNQGLLPPAHSEDNYSEYSLPDSPQRKKDHIRFQDKEGSPSRRGLAYKASRELAIAREQTNDVRLQLKRSQSNIQGWATSHCLATEAELILLI
jgi:hypothetical protein